MKHADFSQSSLVAQMVKNLPAVQEMWVRSLGWEDLMKGMATHFSILAWRLPWTEEPGGLQFMGLQRVGHKLVTEEQKKPVQIAGYHQCLPTYPYTRTQALCG